MALTLNKPAMRWLDLPHGVRVMVHPLTTARATAARNEAQKRVAELRTEAEAAEKAGQPMDAFGFNGASSAALAGLGMEYEIEALARFGIAAWEGVVDPDGNPLPVTPATCQVFAQHNEIGAAFWAEYTDALRKMAAEGNASGISVGSAGQEVPPITAADATDVHSTETADQTDSADLAPQS